MAIVVVLLKDLCAARLPESRKRADLVAIEDRVWPLPPGVKWLHGRSR